MTTFNFVNASLSLLCLVMSAQYVYARPCGLTDPEGDNPDNICHKYTFTPGVHTNAFRPGDGRPVRGLSTTSNPVGPIQIDTGKIQKKKKKTLQKNAIMAYLRSAVLE